jgi:hypothetical protein
MVQVLVVIMQEPKQIILPLDMCVITVMRLLFLLWIIVIMLRTAMQAIVQPPSIIGLVMAQAAAELIILVLPQLVLLLAHIRYWMLLVVR